MAIGSFDGVHLGHQQILHQLTMEAHAAGAPAAVFTFHPHPSVVLRGYHGPIYLTTPEQRAERLDELGVDIVITQPFTPDLSNLSGEDFIRRIQVHLGMKQLWAGYDFAMGRGRQANAKVMAKLGERYGFVYKTFPPIEEGGQVISSSQIRELLKKGNVEGAARKLGRPYQLSGRIVHGEGRGHRLGIPTANMEVVPQMIIPQKGVYACKAIIEGKIWTAAVNVGVRPTFDGSSAPGMTVEAFLLDILPERDLYGKEILLDFITRLRGEIRFNRADELVTQIKEDIEHVRSLVMKG